MTPYEDFELQGAVVELKREEGEPTGRIVVVGNVEDRIRRVTITLPADQYHEAIRAHEEDIPIICYGELIREGRSLVLRNPHGFALVIGSEGTT
jgi:hypothetical protein